MVETVLASPFVRDLLLPFLLVFAITFAVLQKSKILGDGKKQVDAIVALVVGLMVIAVGTTTGIIVGLIPILAVGLVVLLGFFLLWGFAYQEGGFTIHKNVQWIIGIIAAILVVVTVLHLTGAWGWLTELIGGSGSVWVTNILFIVLVIVAVAVVVGFKGNSQSSQSS